MRMMNLMNRVEIRRLLVRAVYKSNRHVDDPIIDQMVELFVEQRDFYRGSVRQLQEAYETEIKRIQEEFETEIKRLQETSETKIKRLQEAFETAIASLRREIQPSHRCDVGRSPPGRGAV